VQTGDGIDLGDRHLRFLQTPYLHWPDTQCTWLEEEGFLFSGDVFGCHFCDARMFNDAVGDFRFSFEYYYAHIMRPFRAHVLEALELIEPLPLKLIAPAHGPILRDAPGRYVARYRELSASGLKNEAADEKTLLVFYLSAYGNTRAMAEAVVTGAEAAGGVRVSLCDIEGGEVSPFVDLIEEADGLVFGSPTINGDAVKPVWDLLSSLTAVKETLNKPPQKSATN
jgi:flavorubredoxin